MKNDDFWNDVDTQLMVTAAHRYCLGRRSYIVGACIDWIMKNRNHFERNTIRVIVRDTVEALQDGLAGSEQIDSQCWKSLASVLFDEMNKDDRDWVMSSVSHRGDWPLG